jgi:hypothetical protein
LESNDQNRGINISENAGDVIGIEVSGNNNIIGKNIVVGSGTISVKDERLYNLPAKYSESLKEFTEKINSELQGQILSEDQKNAINKSIDEFAKEVEDSRVEESKENELPRAKKRELNGKLGTVIKTVLKILPTAAKIGASLFTPLSPFSDLIGEKVENIVNDYLQER